MNREHAETLALSALAFVAADERALKGFLAQTGADPGEMAARAGEADFLAGVMDFMLSDEPLLLAWCDSVGLAPERALAVRRALPGGAGLEW